ncbi:MAG: TRAP transporter substrate-binding protein DctP [Dehalococcoidia bacterium]|nr:TRAP transporter substrate-binding protein DctP [Dehalococcoidia bacterium]
MTKRFLYPAMAIVLVLGVALAACAPQPAPTTPTTPTTPTATTTPTTPSQPAAKVFKYVWQDISPPGAAIYLILQECVDRIRVASGGRLDITLYPEGAITPRDETTPAVRDRGIDMATNAASMDLNRMGPTMYLMGGSGTPASPSTADLIAWMRQGKGIDVMRDVYKDWGIVLGGDPGAAELFAHSNKPLSTAADFRGLKFRTLGLWGEILQEYGASVVQIPGGELYQAVERGVIDAFELGPPSYNWPHGFQEILDYIGVPGIQSPGYMNVILMNHDSWNELPADLQGLLEDELQAMEYYGQLKTKQADAEAMANFIAYGTKVFEVDEDFQRDIAAKSRAYMEQYAVKDATFKSVLDHQTSFFRTWHALAGIEPAATLFD